MNVRRMASTVAAVTSAAVAGSVLVGAAPATAGAAPGVLVAASVMEANEVVAIEFRGMPAMVESDIIIRRSAGSLTILEEGGGPSLALADTTYCTSANPTGTASEVTCSFPSSTASYAYVAVGDFTQAPRGAFLVVEEGSQVKMRFYGSPFDDYFQGGDLDDYAVGLAGGDNLYGGDGHDTLYAGAGDDDVEGENGDDRIWGDAGADTMTGGSGADFLVGGEGGDLVDASDSAADAVDCGDAAASPPIGEDPADVVEADPKLDRTVNCGIGEWPRAVVPPSLSSTSVRVGETLTGTLGEWSGTAPITYSYSFARCDAKSLIVVPPPCRTVKSGTLDAAGRDKGKPPTYTITSADLGSFLTYSVLAKNLPKYGAYRLESAATGIVGPPVKKVAILGTWLPRQAGTKWTLRPWSEFQQAVDRSSIGPFTDIVWKAVRRAAVAVPWRKAVTHGTIVGMKINGKALTPTGRIDVDAAADQRASIEVTYYSVLEDRKTCSMDEANVAGINAALKGTGMPLWGLTAMLDGYVQDCPWEVDWSPEVSQADTFMATGISAVQTDDPDRPVVLRITATQPSLRHGLTMVVGAPPQSHVAQRPDDFSIAADGRLYDFPGLSHTSVWVGLLGDQVRASDKRGLVDLYVNGERVLQESFDAASDQQVPFSTTLTTAALVPGTARVVVSTLDSNGGVESQVFADFVVADGQQSYASELITWDGRCFSTSGTLARCPFSYSDTLSKMQKTLNAALNGGLNTYLGLGDPGVLRYASEKLDKRFVAIVANGAVSPPGGLRATRSRDCWWVDVICHLSNMIAAAGEIVAKPKPSKKTPKPPVQRAYRKLNVLPIGGSSVVGGVVGEGIIKVPGAGLINLDGGTLINLDGGTIISDMGAAFRQEFSGIVSLNGDTVAALNGGTFVGVDGSTLINLDGGTLINLDGGTAAPLPLLTRSG